MLKRRFSRLALWLSLTLVTQSLVLDTPSPADGFNALVTNGTATVSWTSQSGDPERMSIEIQNIVTLDSFEFARNVAVSDGTASGVLDGVPGSPHYYLQAVMTGNSNIFQVLANSSTFTVNGLVPSTTDSALVPHTSTTSTTSSTSSFATSSATPSSVEASGVNSNTSGSGSPIGTIVGGTLGGVAGVILLSNL
ncbi:hypothetical protein K435DRAFT_93316 [Dendrothele bispora CBS 962.96]|uniref:Fibronectin type-III domain-containing protein n=1 Tax=Dendrothele bispora (strain CBS 962.96) TaxID=1314807 RepID=A0A4S8MR87_DENBC|nr:hypothetical protein K435DRAFT_93316 [Dendrothele bispora CBS 962.96]